MPAFSSERGQERTATYRGKSPYYTLAL